MKYGLISDTQKADVESRTRDYCKKLSGIKLPIMTYLSDRYWIMSFATNAPIIPIPEYRTKLHRDLAASIAPASMVPLFATDSQKMLDNGIMGLDPLEDMSLTAVNEHSRDQDALYLKACKAEAYFLSHDIYDGERSHRTHMWAVGRARLRLEYLAEAFKSVPKEVRARFPETDDKHGLLPDLFDKWLSIAMKCEDQWPTLDPKSADYQALGRAVDALQDALAVTATLLTFASHDHKSICEIGGWDDALPKDKIKLREDARGELYRAYPQVFRFAQTTGMCVRSNVHHPNNLTILGDKEKGFTVHADLRIGVQGYNEAFSRMNVSHDNLYPTLAYMCIAEPKHHAFFINMKKVLDKADATYASKGCAEIPTPYYDDVRGKLLTRSEAVQLPRLVVKKATGMEVSPVNPSVPSRLARSITAIDGSESVAKGALVGGSSLKGSCSVRVFEHARLLLPDDFTAYKRNKRKDDPVFESVGDGEFLIGFDFILSTPGLSDGVQLYDRDSWLGYTTVAEIGTAAHPSEISLGIDGVLKIRVATKGEITRYTIFISNPKKKEAKK